MKAEISAIDQQILEVEGVFGRYDDGLIKGLAKARREALLLSCAVLQNRVLVSEGEGPTEFVTPVSQPNEEQASTFLGEITDVQLLIDH